MPLPLTLSAPQKLVARYGGIDEQRPGLDAAPEIVEIAESFMSEVLRGLLTAYTVVALEDDGRLPIQTEQHIVISLIKQTRPVDLRACAFLVGADVDQFDRHTAFEQGLQLRSWQLANGRRLVRLGVLTHRWLILVRQVPLGQSVAAGGVEPRDRQLDDASEEMREPRVAVTR